MEKMKDPAKESDLVSMSDLASGQPLVPLRAHCSAGRMAFRSVLPTARSKAHRSVEMKGHQTAMPKAPGSVRPKDVS